MNFFTKESDEGVKSIWHNLPIMGTVRQLSDIVVADVKYHHCIEVPNPEVILTQAKRSTNKNTCKSAWSIE